MKKRNKTMLLIAVGLIVTFIAWTVLVRSIDVQEVGPNSSSVGLATVNTWFHSVTGTNMSLYVVTDWLGLVPVGVALAFAILGLVQLIKRRSFLKVDHSILALGGFYIAVIAAYVIFEYAVINYRPVLIEGYLEASYPSSTTLLVLCVMPTAAMQMKDRIKNKLLGKLLRLAIIAFTAFMVIGRLVSGVHWLSDIVGGILLSSGLVAMYAWASELTKA